MQHGNDDDESDTLAHLTSPQFKPHVGSKPPALGGTTLIPSGGQFSPGGLGGLGGKLKASGGGMGKKVFSMMDLSAAADESEGGLSPLPVAGGMGMKKTKQPAAAAAAASDDYSDSDSDEEFQPVLEHTVGRPRQGGGMKRSQSQLTFMNVDAAGGVFDQINKQLTPQSVNMLIVLDMDHTMVGDLVSLSDRDNIETNVPWTYWPEGKERGLSANYIYPFLERGMMRPGMIALLEWFRSIGAVVVVYTHSEEKWATKVCEAMEKAAGWHFIARLFSRNDCRDGHPEFTARKSLEYVIERCKVLDQLHWADMTNTIMFDDDGNALNKEESHRLVKVASYDYWEACQWDEIVNEDLMSRNDEELAGMVRRSVVEWGIAAPSYGKTTRTAEDVKKDARWAVQRQQKHQILLSYNKVARLDRVMFDIHTAMSRGLGDLTTLPEKIRTLLGKSTQPASRRQRN
uniref:FCP1 homology domain-containing protein n=1 Tax=Hemiselmis andersenii TaxID=464988 RepID=A0A6U4Q3E7_HEMAN|mmetsp:Transcript_8472/g.19790  ORF Transcript_8472/g.19790 Transcript_8472/m.19790 type:complete len:458 (+) Transcript_8472:152-1525(+)